MAGHSKWANIKHKKAANDKKRGKLWSKLIREVTVAAKEGGGYINTNPRLRLAVDKARGAGGRRAPLACSTWPLIAWGSISSRAWPLSTRLPDSTMISTTGPVTLLDTRARLAGWTIPRTSMGREVSTRCAVTV